MRADRGATAHLEVAILKVLLTGATGYIGRYLLNRLVEDQSFEKIYVVSRSREVFPAKKVEVVKGDLAVAGTLNYIKSPIDAVVHLAGEYNFSGTDSSNYKSNVIATLNLVQWMRRDHERAVLYYASSYAALAGQWHNNESEIPIDILPPTSIPYAYTKAIADQVVSQSGLNAAIYRFGSVICDSRDGQFDKIDGPYYILDALEKITRFKLIKNNLGALPFHGNPKSLLPLVPVDSAVEVIIKGLKQHKPELVKIYGVFNSTSLPVENMLDEILKFFEMNPKVVYLSSISNLMATIQNRLLSIPPNLIDFCYSTSKLHNQGFIKTYGDIIPSFDSYKKQFFNGYSEFKLGLRNE